MRLQVNNHGRWHCYFLKIIMISLKTCLGKHFEILKIPSQKMTWAGTQFVKKSWFKGPIWVNNFNIPKIIITANKTSITLPLHYQLPFLPLLPLPTSTCLCLPLPAFSCEIQHYGQTHRQTDTLNICTSRAASLQLKRKLKKIETWYSLKRD